MVAVETESVAVAGDRTRLIVVFVVQRRPTIGGQSLPSGLHRFELFQVEFYREEAHPHIDVHQLERDGGIQFVPAFAYQFGGVRVFTAYSFADYHRVVFAPGLLVYFVQVLVNMRSQDKVFVAAHYRIELTVRQSFLFRNIGYDVATEAVYAQIEPVIAYIYDFLPDLGIIPIQIGLLFAEQVQVPFSRRFVVFPRFSRKTRSPIIRRTFAVFASALPPNIIIAIRIVDGGTALFEPFVLVRGMVYDQIHHQADAAFMHFGDHFFPIVQSAEFGVYIAVIGNIVAVIVVRRFIYGGKPYGVYSKLFQIVQL